MTTRSQSEFLAGLEMMQKGAAIVMVIFLVVGAGALLMLTGGVSQPTTILLLGLEALNAGFTFMIAAGALHGHRAMLKRQSELEDLIARQAAQIEDLLAKLSRELDTRMERLERLERRLLEAAADEVGHRRAGHHHN